MQNITRVIGLTCKRQRWDIQSLCTFFDVVLFKCMLSHLSCFSFFLDVSLMISHVFSSVSSGSLLSSHRLKRLFMSRRFLRSAYLCPQTYRPSPHYQCIVDRQGSHPFKQNPIALSPRFRLYPLATFTPFRLECVSRDKNNKTTLCVSSYLHFNGPDILSERGIFRVPFRLP